MTDTNIITNESLDIAKEIVDKYREKKRAERATEHTAPPTAGNTDESDEELAQLELLRKAGGLTDQAETDYQFTKNQPELNDPVMTMELPKDNVIQMHYDWGIDAQDAYPEYHVLNIMVLLSHVIPARMSPVFGDVYNNLWGITLGGSGTSGKSSTVKGLIGITLTPDVRQNINRMPDKPTPEAFAEILSIQPRQLWIIDEAAGFLKFLKREYASELEEDVCKAYDHSDFSRKKVKKKQDEGLVQVVNPHVSILWNTVPESFAKNAQIDKFEDGLFLRPLYMIPQRDKPVKRDTVASQETRNKRAVVIHRIKELIAALESHHGQEIIFRENDIINDWKYNHRLGLQKVKSDIKRAAMTRSFEHARKIAMVLTIGSMEFLTDLKKSPKYDFAHKSDCLVVPHELLFDIPDWAARKSIEWMDTVFIPYFSLAFKIANATPGTFSKVQKLFDEGGWVTRMQIADMTKKHGRYLDEFILEFDVETTVQKRQETMGPPVTYYRQKVV